ncbi:MAG: outer membrane protein assembly factor BamE [Gammaproteobacteria bacterium]|nr:outer membrane protein assembly factor BamE [Gammaproteobacteria bacterium]
MKLRFTIIVALVVTIVTSSGCLYRMDISQGNRIDSEQVDQLKLGMSSRQVEFLLGKPAIVDIFHPYTWHYVYYHRSGEDLSEQKRTMSLRFENDSLKEIKGDSEFASES